MKSTTLIAILMSLFISACSAPRSLSSFEKMDADKRARVVCNNASEARTLSTNLKLQKDASAEITGFINEITATLNRGYRVHTQCTTKYREIEECTESYGKVTCKKVKDPYDWVGTQSCTETPVSIDPNYEERRLLGLLMKKEELDEDISSLSTKSNKYQTDCRSRAWSLSATEAYEHFYRQTAP